MAKTATIISHKILVKTSLNMSDSDETCSYTSDRENARSSIPPAKTARSTRKRRMPNHLQESQVEIDTHFRKISGKMAVVLLSVSFLYSIIRQSQSCMQPNWKAFHASVEELSKENGEGLYQEDIVDGNNVLYENDGGKSCDVTIRPKSI